MHVQKSPNRHLSSVQGDPADAVLTNVGAVPLFPEGPELFPGPFDLTPTPNLHSINFADSLLLHPSSLPLF